MLNYLLQNWISIVALLISLISLVVGIVTRRETRQIQLEEQNGELLSNGIKILSQAADLVSDLEDTKNEYDRVMKLLVSYNKSHSSILSPERIHAANVFLTMGKNIETHLSVMTNIQKAIEYVLGKKFTSLPAITSILGSFKAYKEVVENDQSMLDHWHSVMETMEKAITNEVL